MAEIQDRHQLILQPVHQIQIQHPENKTSLYLH